MPLKVNWEGVFPAIPTQFKEDLSIDIEATQKHTEALVNNGIHGIVMLGTIGEGTSLTLSEKVEVLRATVEVAGGKVPVLSGIAEFTTQGACDTVKAAGEAGVDGIMLLPAMVYKSDARETIAHFRTVANSTHLPIMCYNNPPVYRVDITPEMFKELIDVENIVVIKEASGDVRRITELFNALNDRFLIFAGLDDVALESFMLGCTGWISGLVESGALGCCHVRRLRAGSGDLPLVHAHAALRLASQARAIHQTHLPGAGLRPRANASAAPTIGG